MVLIDQLFALIPAENDIGHCHFIVPSADDQIIVKERLTLNRRASMKAGRIGWRYTIRTRNRQRYLYHEIGEGNRWFVENKDIYYPEYDKPSS